MSKFVVVVFSDQAKAVAGVSALRQLHRDRSITLYGATVLARDQKGALSIKQRTDEGPIGAGVDLMVGALMGPFAGPRGGGAGVLAGGLRDVIRVEVSADLLESMERELTPGKFALVADLSEEWVAHVDVRMGELGGQVVLREPRPLHFRAVGDTADEEGAAQGRARQHQGGDQASGANPDLKKRIRERTTDTRRGLAEREQKQTRALERARDSIHA